MSANKNFPYTELTSLQRLNFLIFDKTKVHTQKLEKIANIVGDSPGMMVFFNVLGAIIIPRITIASFTTGSFYAFHHSFQIQKLQTLSNTTNELAREAHIYHERAFPANILHTHLLEQCSRTIPNDKEQLNKPTTNAANCKVAVDEYFKQAFLWQKKLEDEKRRAECAKELLEFKYLNL